MKEKSLKLKRWQRKVIKNSQKTCERAVKWFFLFQLRFSLMAMENFLILRARREKCFDEREI